MTPKLRTCSAIVLSAFCLYLIVTRAGQAGVTNLAMLKVPPHVVEARPLAVLELIKPAERRTNAELTTAQSILQDLSARFREPRFFRTLTALLLVSGESEQAQAAAAQAGDTTLMAMLQAFLYSQLNQQELAVEKLRLVPGVNRQLIAAGIAEWEKGNKEDGFALVELAERIDKAANLDQAIAYTAYGILSDGAIWVRGDRQQAIDWAHQRIRIIPQAPEAYLQLASYYTTWETHPEEARPILRQIGELRGQTDFRYYYYWGIVYQSEGNLEQAALNYQTAARMRPDNMYILWPLGQMLFHLGRWQDARTPLEEVVRSFTQRPDLQQRATEMLQQMGTQLP